MEERRIYKCFVSSPGDCIEERKACFKAIEEINNGLARHLGVNFEVIMWENDVLPDFGQTGQEIIDSFIESSDYDIFVGLMKNRFGTPTNTAGSGTEHEFLKALKRKDTQKNSFPRILFFFGRERIFPDEFDYAQYQKVLDFKSKLKGLGLYIEFDEVSSFKESLIKKLELFIRDNSPLPCPSQKISEVDMILKRLELDLSNSLKTYNEKSPIWIEPILSSKREIPENPTKNNDFRIDLKSIIVEPKDIVIKAPSEFGLTSLAHYLKLEAWKIGKAFLYIDSKNTRKHKVVKDIYTEMESCFLLSKAKPDCILLDSISFEESGIMQMIKNICVEFSNVPLVICNTLDDVFFIKTDEDSKIEIHREFLSYYLLPLPQNEVRKLVSSYSNQKSLDEDEDVLLYKVTKDLESLNMHRTAKNCISILRACYRIGSEYCPVNRTKLLETILYTIFDEYKISTYHDKKPDVKDCSFVLGYLCELLVYKDSFNFSQDFFIQEIKTFCQENFIDLDVSFLLKVLNDNSILISNQSGLLYFKNSYWIFYFLAQRMTMSMTFHDFIFENKKYIDFPQIIEFYTGFDRNKVDALLQLKSDLNETLSLVKTRVNIPDSINPYKSISWHPDVDVLLKEEAKIGEGVLSSGLPDEVKDRYEDKHYDQIKPYNQVINSVMRDYYFLVLMRQISAVSRALRNSDFVRPDIKQQLLDVIIQCWGEVGKLLIVISPLLADQGSVAFEGACFSLEEEDFNMLDSQNKRLAVLTSIPTNIVKFFKDDLFSAKMGPLLFDKAEKENNSLLKHELMLLLIAERPKGWYRLIDSYIVKIDKDSFFLYDVLLAINYNIEYSSTLVEDKSSLRLLASKCRAKNIFKNNNPDIGLINRLKKLENGNKHFR